MRLRFLGLSLPTSDLIAERQTTPSIMNSGSTTGRTEQAVRDRAGRQTDRQTGRQTDRQMFEQRRTGISNEHRDR